MSFTPMEKRLELLSEAGVPHIDNYSKGGAVNRGFDMHWDCNRKFEKKPSEMSRRPALRFVDVAGLSEMQSTPTEYDEAETLSAIKHLVLEQQSVS